MKKIAVLGIGNILLRDDGVGIHTINQLQKEEYFQNIELIDGGTCIFDLLDIFIKNDKVIVIDSLKGGHPFGTIYRVTPEDLPSYIKSNTSLHDVQLLDLLTDINRMGYNPEVIIIGVEPKEICFDLELSDEIREQIPKVIKEVKEELERA